MYKNIGQLFPLLRKIQTYCQNACITNLKNPTFIFHNRNNAFPGKFPVSTIIIALSVNAKCTNTSRWRAITTVCGTVSMSTIVEARASPRYFFVIHYEHILLRQLFCVDMSLHTNNSQYKGVWSKSSLAIN